LAQHVLLQHDPEQHLPLQFVCPGPQHMPLQFVCPVLQHMPLLQT